VTADATGPHAAAAAPDRAALGEGGAPHPTEGRSGVPATLGTSARAQEDDKMGKSDPEAAAAGGTPGAAAPPAPAGADGHAGYQFGVAELRPVLACLQPRLGPPEEGAVEAAGAGRGRRPARLRAA
jgi:hypothetical protein